MYTTKGEKKIIKLRRYKSCYLPQQPVCLMYWCNCGTSIVGVTTYFDWIQGPLHERKSIPDTAKRAKKLRLDDYGPRGKPNTIIQLKKHSNNES